LLTTQKKAQIILAVGQTEELIYRQHQEKVQINMAVGQTEGVFIMQSRNLYEVIIWYKNDTVIFSYSKPKQHQGIGSSYCRMKYST
jgi:phosphoribosylformylglycinamidine (FGAM) synthase-like amidotransferase family enzyme